jgi:GT2 family glycosyltransferase
MSRDDTKITSAQTYSNVPDSVTTRIVAIVLTVNQCENTVRCIRSLLSVSHPAFTVIVWDNGSTDGTGEVLAREFPMVLYHWNESNLGAAGGRNAGVAFANEILNFSPTHLLFLDNDTEVTPDFLHHLHEPFQENPRVGQSSAKIMFLRHPEIINSAGGSDIRFWLGSTRPRGYGELDRGQYDQPVDCIAPAGCTLVLAKAFHEVGGFDVRFDPYGCEDLDLSARIVKAGYQCIYAPKSVIFHDPSQTFERGSYTGAYAQKKVENWLLFLQRHGKFHQKLLFYTLGAPYSASLTVVRELRKGNFSAIVGLMKGIVRFVSLSNRR